jgi:hypothetical protein
MKMSPNEKPVFWANSIRLNEPEQILKEQGWRHGSRPAASDFNWLFNTIQKDIHAAKLEIEALKEKISEEAAELNKKLAAQSIFATEIKKTADHALEHGHINRENTSTIIQNIKDTYLDLNDLVNELRYHIPALKRRQWRFKDQFELSDEKRGSRSARGR